MNIPVLWILWVFDGFLHEFSYISQTLQFLMSPLQEGLLEPPADSRGGFRFDSTCDDVKRFGSGAVDVGEWMLGGAGLPMFTYELINCAVLSDEQMRKILPFSLLNDEQMSNKVGVKHQPVNSLFFCMAYTSPTDPK